MTDEQRIAERLADLFLNLEQLRTASASTREGLEKEEGVILSDIRNIAMNAIVDPKI